MIKGVDSRLYDGRYFRHSGGSKYFLKDKIAPIYYKAILMSSLRKRKSMIFLDVGCGRGDLIKVLLTKFDNPYIIGVDYSDAAVRIAKKRCGESQNVKIIKCDAISLPLKDDMIDCVFLLDFVEHLYPEHLHRVMKEIHRVMRRGGRLIIHTFPTKYMNDVAHFILKLFNKPSIGQEMHVNTQTYFSMRNLLLDNHFKNIQIFLENRDKLLQHNIDVESRVMKALLKIGDRFYNNVAKAFNFFPFRYFLLSDIWAIAEK